MYTLLYSLTTIDVLDIISMKSEIGVPRQIRKTTKKTPLGMAKNFEGNRVTEMASDD